MFQIRVVKFQAAFSIDAIINRVRIVDREKKKVKYTCNEYRDEMILAGLQKRLQDTALSKEERLSLQKEIDQLSVKMGM